VEIDPLTQASDRKTARFSAHHIQDLPDSRGAPSRTRRRTLWEFKR
jgi:hypothetical protein